METIFIDILNMSISAGWVILAVLLLRVLLRKAPKAMRCCLWILVGIRLICPISLESALSLLPSAEPIPQEILYDASPAIESGIESIDNVVNPILSSSLAPAPGDSANPMQVILHIASLLWVAGALAMAFYAMGSSVRLRRRVAASIRLEGNLWICDDISSPFIFGILSPRIYLPSHLDETQLACVIAHEKSHLKRHDHWWKPLGFLLLSVYWFHPLCWAAYILLCRDIELACDERVIKSMETEDKKNYARTLLSCGIPRRVISSCPLAFGEISVGERVRTVLNYRKPSFWVAAAGILACGAAAVCFLTSPVSGGKDIFGAGYHVREILYDAPWYNFTYTLDNAPEYALTEDYCLMERDKEGPLGNDSWSLLGGLGAVEYSREELLAFFGYRKNAAGITEPLKTPETSFLSDKARQKLGRAENIWRVNVGDENNRFFLVIQTSEGEVLLGMGYDRADTSHIRWLWEMERESPRFSQEYLASQIASMCGSDVSIFSVYESDTIPNKIIVGFHSEKGNKPGFAVFHCRDSKDSWQYSIKGYHTFARESVNSFTVGEDWGFDHSVTIVLNHVRNLSLLQARTGSMLLEAVPGRNAPSMVVFEWPELLSEEAAAAVELFPLTAENEQALSGSSQSSAPENEDLEIEAPEKTQDAPAASEISDSDYLEAAISAAILEHCADDPPHESQSSEESFSSFDSLFRCESHLLLEAPQHNIVNTAPDVSSSPAGSNGQSDETIVYIMAMYQVYRLSPEGIQVIDRRYFPARLTFSHSGEFSSAGDSDKVHGSDQGTGRAPISGSDYILKEFREPGEMYTGTQRDGYEAWSREMFPEELAEKAIVFLTAQPHIDFHTQACYAQAVAYGELDTDRIIEGLFETIVSSASGESANPYACITACPVECIALHYYGEYTLDYIRRQLQENDGTDLKGQLMKIMEEEMNRLSEAFHS